MVPPRVSLAALDAGSGTQVLLLHGSVGDMTEFPRILTALAGKYHATALSRRYHPPNEPPSSGDLYLMDRQAGDLLEVLSQTGPAHVVGISWGGYASLVAALDRPDLFRSIVLAEPPVLPLLEGSAAGQRFLKNFLTTAIEPAAEAFRSGNGERGLALFMDGILGRAGGFESIPTPVRKELYRFVPELGLELTTPFERYMPALPPDRLRALRVPVLLLQGSRSPEMFGTILDSLQAQLRCAVRERIPDAGHAMHLANPGRFIACVESFFESEEKQPWIVTKERPGS